MTDGVAATPIPASLNAAILAAAVPLPPLTIAPAWPIRRPGGAVAPAIKPATGFRPCFLIHSATSSSALPPISPIRITPRVSGSSLNILMTSRCDVPVTGSPPMPAKGGGTKIADAVAPVCFAASATVSKMGTLFSNCWPPLPGVTPATIWVPYSRLSFVCRAPKLPVMPCTRTLVWAVTRMDMEKFAMSDFRFTKVLAARIALVYADRIAVRIKNHRHAADRRGHWFDAELHILFFQMRDGGVEVFDLQRGGAAVGTRLGRGCGADSPRIRAEFVLRPLAVLWIFYGF